MKLSDALHLNDKMKAFRPERDGERENFSLRFLSQLNKILLSQNEYWS